MMPERAQRSNGPDAAWLAARWTWNRDVNETVVARILARPGHGLDAEAQRALRRMADYFDRASLLIRRDDGAPGDRLELVLSDAAVTYAVTVGELRSLLRSMSGGEALDWTRLRRVDAG